MTSSIVFGIKHLKLWFYLKIPVTSFRFQLVKDLLKSHSTKPNLFIIKKIGRLWLTDCLNWNVAVSFGSYIVVASKTFVGRIKVVIYTKKSNQKLDCIYLSSATRASKGSSHPFVHSIWASRNVITGALTIRAPLNLALINPVRLWFRNRVIGIGNVLTNRSSCNPKWAANTKSPFQLCVYFIKLNTFFVTT